MACMELAQEGIIAKMEANLRLHPCASATMIAAK